MDGNRNRNRNTIRIKALLVAVTTLVAALPAASQDEPLYPDVNARIREEGFQRSQVMDFASMISDVLGPRVTGSAGMRRAQTWAESKMESMGLVNTVIEPFAEHTASWDNLYTSLHVIEPAYQPLIGYPYAFTPGTDGKVTAEVAVAIVRRPEDLDALRGALRGKVVLSAPPRDLPPRFEADAERLSRDALDRMAASTIASRYGVGQRDHEWDPQVMSFAPVEDPRDRGLLEPSSDERARFLEEVQSFYKTEGVAAVLDPAFGRDGTVFVGGRPGSRYDRSYEGALAAPVRIALAAEHYNRIFRLVERGLSVRLELEVRNALERNEAQARNVLGDLRGSGRANEIVMVGGHFDSWHAGTGATDDGAGCAVALEAVRILQAIGARPRRTIRVALWSWEEGGKVGSRRYVEEHFRAGGVAPEGETLSVYLNMDNGTGQFRGVYLQGNEAARNVFARWMAPFRDLKMDTLTIDHTFGVDIVGFDMAGLPAFQFIQDPLDYDSRTHHSNMDVYDRLVPEDLRKNAVILASFLYHAAMREDLFPRETH